MATGLIAQSVLDAGGGEITHGRSIGATAEAQRATAEIQAAMIIAQHNPRDEIEAIERIKVSCQRVGLAQRAEYCFSRGGTEISGATIDLLTVIANQWGNIQFGFRELSANNGESTVEAFAWDLQTNTKRTVVFTVPHKRFAGGRLNPLLDPRDIYELIANNAQRRVRACLEAVIPPDVVDTALDECTSTLNVKDPLTPESIKALAARFLDGFGVTREQIEARIQRKLESMTPAQRNSLVKIGKSLADGMSKVEDWFKPIEESKPSSNGDAKPKTGTDAAKEKLKGSTAKPQPPAPAPAELQKPEPQETTKTTAKPKSAPKGKAAQASLVDDDPQPTAQATAQRSEVFLHYQREINGATTLKAIQKQSDTIANDGSVPKHEKELLFRMLNEYAEILREQASQ